MKREKRAFFNCCMLLSMVLTMFLLMSCTSLIFGKNSARMEDELPKDVSEYCDHHLKNYRFPDGKVADVYVFDSVGDQYYWQSVQRGAVNPETRKLYKERIAESKTKQQEYAQQYGQNSMPAKQQGKFIAEYNWRLNVKGPNTPFYKVFFSLVEQYGGEDKVMEMAKAQGAMPAISYYKLEDLGELAAYMTEGAAAQATFEDATGAYLLTIAPPKNMTQLQKNKAEQKRHKGELAYEVAYIPRTAYPKITPPKLSPAKVTPINPNSIPDSDRNLSPVSPSGNGAYYYDEDLAYQLQWLAVKIACKGVYDMAYTGDFRAKNPTDHYKTSFIKKYLATNDGRASKGTTLFEGICFDYADFAYQELSENRKNYSSRITNFFMVGTFEDSNDIVAYRLAKDGERSDMTINRTPVVVYNHNHIRAHGDATSHAWFWVVAADGTVYWVDPTWTDNSGRPVYGIVRGGQEMPLPPASALCVN